MQLRRFKDIIAFKNDTSVEQNDTIIAFHASNLEVAEISEESFQEMSDINLSTGEAPEVSSEDNNSDALQALSEWNDEYNSNLKNSKNDNQIRSITLNINQICNLKCSYCAAGGDGTYGESINKLSIEKTFPQIKFLVEKLELNSSFSIAFVGGEPLLQPEIIYDLYNYVIDICLNKNITPIFKIVTNGTLINEKTIPFLRKMKVYLLISLDGTKEVNDAVRPSKSGESPTDLILKGLQLLSEDKGKIQSIGITSVFSSLNTDLLNNYIFFTKLNPDWIEFNFDYSEKSTNLQKVYLSEMTEVAKVAWANGKETSLRKIKNFDEVFTRLDTQKRLENHCGSGKTFLMVDSKNNFYTCPWEVGNASEKVGSNTYIDIEKLANYKKTLIELNNCQTCWARFICGGGCMYIHKTHTGNKHIKDNLFCERIRSLILIAISYYKLSRDV